MSPERAGYASMERARSFHEEGGKRGGEGGSYVSIPGRFSSVSTRNFRCSSTNSPGQWNRRLALRAMKVKEGVDVGVDVGGCLLTLRGHRYCFGGLRGE